MFTLIFKIDIYVTFIETLSAAKTLQVKTKIRTKILVLFLYNFRLVLSWVIIGLIFRACIVSSIRSVAKRVTLGCQVCYYEEFAYI
jgi:sulfite exporter TauE/SafE